MSDAVPLYFEEPRDIFEFFGDNPHLFIEALYDAIKGGIEKQLDSVDIFDLNDTGICISSGKEEWNTALIMIQNFFNEREEYEKSKEVQQYIEKL